MNRIKLIVALILGASLLNAAKLGNVPDIYKPRCMGVYNNNLYVADQGCILIFGLNDLKLKNRFVRPGRGPGEFNNTPLFTFHHKNVLVYGSFKVARFDLNGKYISESKAEKYFFALGIVGENYVLRRTDYYTTKSGNPIYSIGLFDNKFQKISDLAKMERIVKKNGTTRIMPLVSNVYKFRTFENKIYIVADETDFRVKVFNSKGKLEKIIRHEYKRIKIPDEYKVRKYEFIKDLVGPKKWPRFKKNREFSFPEYFPAIKDFLVTEGKIYVNTYLEKEGNEEFWVLTLEGELLKKIFLPPARELFRCIRNSRFYYLIENEDEEEWELHSVKIQ